MLRTLAVRKLLALLNIAMASENFLILNSLNWAIIASSALGGFGQFVENRHKEKFAQLKKSSRRLLKLLASDSATSTWSAGEIEWVKIIANDADGQKRINMRIPIVGLFILVSFICFINAIGIWLVWFHDTDAAKAISNFLNVHDPMLSYNIPLGGVGVTLVALCWLMIIQLCMVRSRQASFDDMQIELDKKIDMVEK